MYFFHYNLLCGSRDLYAVKGYSICVIIKCAQALLVVFITWPESRHWGYLRQRHPEHPRRLRCQPERFGFGVKQRAYVGQHNVLWGGLMDCQFASCQLTVPHVLSLLPSPQLSWLADFWFSFYKRQKRQQKSINVNGDKLIKLRQKDFE